MKVVVTVRANAGRQEVVEVSSGEYKVFLKRAPENNKANEELVILLQKHFKKKVVILRGKTSRRKLVELKD